jgi:hypothetical protein
MKIIFSKNDAEKILYDSFCNGGLTELSFCSLSIYWDIISNYENYENAKNRLKGKGMTSICREDVYIEILRNGDNITFKDFEEDNTIDMNLEDALSNFNSLKEEDKIKLAKLLDDNESTDAWDCFNALQYALYCEVIYG